MRYSTKNVERLIAAYQLLLSPDAPGGTSNRGW